MGIQTVTPGKDFCFRGLRYPKDICYFRPLPQVNSFGETLLIFAQHARFRHIDETGTDEPIHITAMLFIIAHRRSVFGHSIRHPSGRERGRELEL
jgi:hypothetical protein